VATETKHTIDPMLLEERRYLPPEEFASQANAQAAIHDRDFEEFGKTEGLVFDREEVRARPGRSLWMNTVDSSCISTPSWGGRRAC
jgi:hypothetical protein